MNISRYIDWKKVDHIKVDFKEWNALMDLYEQEGYHIPCSIGNKTITICRGKPFTYNIERRTNSISMFACTEDADFKVYYAMFDQNKSDLKSSKSGAEAVQEIRAEFLRLYSTSMLKAYGITKQFVFHNCVKACRRSMWVNPIGRGQILDGLCKADISSCYPYELSKDLPTLVDAKIVPGAQEPNEEYPFVFYLHSGHIMIWNELDTRELMLNPYYLKIVGQKDPKKIYWKMPEADEVSVCCKKCDYSLKPIMEKFYQFKQTMTGQEKEDMKQVLVASIGYLESEDFNKWCNQQFLSAIVYARTLKRMIGLAEKIEDSGGIPLMMLIDSIIWKGPMIDECVDKSSATLGSFVKEYENVQGCYLGQGQYALADEGKILIIKHQGVDAATVNSWNVQSLEDFLSRRKQMVEQEWKLNDDNRFVNLKNIKEGC